MTKILLAILILLVVFAGVVTFTQQEKQPTADNLNQYGKIIGSNSNGTVYKIIAGNTQSSDTAIMILGVHSLESGIHNATYEAIMNFTKDNKDSGMNTSDYDTNRHMGELLANEFVVPDIENYDPYVIVDAHEMEDYWELQKYVGVVDNESATTMDYANKIGDNLSYPVYPVRTGTSPEWVTIPLAKKNHNVILFETAQNDTQHDKGLTAINLVRCIDSLPIQK
ncbi:hypothetical protein [uncultured Methanobrevibacter sp.]|uniref:hypothetical protein n=1 Tax=uncultured Methanobrevibacter sp. TaxID=253161 RepID=UPI0025E60F76|nr:hypothetical protein [uncultured Methanobrevibacter sp.]